VKKANLPLVLFNASVILAGIKSLSGGSGKLLSWSKDKRIKGLISEIILDEAMRNGPRIGVEPMVVGKEIEKLGIIICAAPNLSVVDKFKKIVIDLGDAHVLASAEEKKADFLVTLDKKHLLILQKVVKQFKIVSPGELIATLR
jgi:predicted nucleic acid-binding protein